MQTDLGTRRAELTPRSPAVRFRGQWYTYEQLNRRAGQLAKRLIDLGVAAGDRVSIVATNHIAHVDLFLAAAKIGFIYTPFNFRLPPAEQRGLGRYIEPKLMLHDAERAEHAKASGAPTLDLETYEEWLQNAPRFTPRIQDYGAEEPAMILFTGGSTGLPKGAVIPYRQLYWNNSGTCLAWGLSDKDCAIQATPAFHAAFNVLTSPLLHTGGRVILSEAFDPGDYLNTISAHGVTVLFLVPTMYQMLCEHPGFDAADLSSVRWAISGGAPCPEPIRERFKQRGIRFKQGYGMTEAGVNCFSIDLNDAQRRPTSVGKPVPHSKAVIRDEDGKPVPRGEVGELTIQGPHVCLGYFKKPEETSKSQRDGWLWTGDLARQDEEGFYYIVGRSKEMFISGGENVFPVEVEAAIYEQAEVAECAVLGVAHPRWGETGLAAIALKPGKKVGEETVRKRLKKRLAGYKVPTRYMFLDELPKTGAGKVNKPEIRKRFEKAATD